VHGYVFFLLCVVHSWYAPALCASIARQAFEKKPLTRHPTAGLSLALPCHLTAPSAGVRSSRALAALVCVDASAALALPGVTACLTARDIPEGGSNSVFGAPLLAGGVMLETATTRNGVFRV